MYTHTYIYIYTCTKLLTQHPFLKGNHCEHIPKVRPISICLKSLLPIVSLNSLHSEKRNCHEVLVVQTHAR